MKITLKDIARKANVSTATVSMVLNNRNHRVSAEKRDEIIKIAQKYNYKVNLVARSLVTNESKILGLILPDLENIYFSSLAQQLEQIVRHEGYALFIVSSNEKLSDDLWLIDHLENRGVDGIFICPSNEAFTTDVLAKRLSCLSIPFVVIDRVFRDYPFNKVSFDNHWGSYVAVEYLIEQGHRRIGCIAPPHVQHTDSSRLQGYFSALTDRQIAIDESLVYEGDYRFASGYEHGKSLIENHDVTAIFSCNDMMTLGLIRYINERKMSVPKDISIVSYDNVLDIFALNVGISAVEQDVSLLVQSSHEIMMNLLYSPKYTTVQEIRYKPQLIKKGSVNEIKNS